jgi:hypothetical protein
MDSETARLVGAVKVPREPSGNESVSISTEDNVVVAFDCNEVIGRFVWSSDGLGGSGGRSSPPLFFSFPLPAPNEATLFSSMVIGAVAPSFVAVFADGESSIARVCSWDGDDLDGTEEFPI